MASLPSPRWRSVARRRRGVWRRGTVVAACVTAVLSAAPCASAVPASITPTPCPIPAAELGPGAVSPTPGTVAVPAGLTVPANGRIYVTPDTGGRVLTTLGPPGFHCKAVLGGDGTLAVSLTDPITGANAIAVSFDVSPGEAFPLACPYIPAAQRAFARDGGIAYDPKLCRAPRRDRVTQLPTASGTLLAAAIQIPPGVRDPDLNAYSPQPLSGGTNSVLAVVTSELPRGQVSATAQAVACSLPTAEASICAASLAWFLATSDVGTRLGAGLTPALAGLAAALNSPSTPPTLPGEPVGHLTCYPDVSFDNRLAQFAKIPISIPSGSLTLPEGVGGDIAVDFLLNSADVCKNGLTDTLGTLPGVYTDAGLSIGATATDGSSFGPFVYSPPQLAWVSTPGVSPDQPGLVTDFSVAKVEASINPHLSLAFTGDDVVPAVALADFTLSAPEVPVTTVDGKDVLMRVSLGPKLQVQAEVSPQDIEQTVQQTEDGIDSEDPAAVRQTAITDTAEQVSADAIGGAGEDISAIYGASVQTAERSLESQLYRVIVVALDNDSLLVVVSTLAPIESDPAPIEADIAPIDEAIGPEVFDVGALGDLFAIFLL